MWLGRTMRWPTCCLELDNVNDLAIARRDVVETFSTFMESSYEGECLHKTDSWAQWWWIFMVREGKGGIYTILHIPTSKIHRASVLLMGSLLVLKFPMDMQLLVLLKDNLHICSSKSHELNDGYLIHLWHQLFSMEWKHGEWVLTRNITGKILKTFSHNDCPHNEE